MLINFTSNYIKPRINRDYIDSTKKTEYNSAGNYWNTIDVFEKHIDKYTKFEVKMKNASFDEIQEKIKEKIAAFRTEDTTDWTENRKILDDDKYAKEISFIDSKGKLREVHKYLGEQLSDVTMFDADGNEVTYNSVVYPEFNETEVIIVSENSLNGETEIIKFSGVDLSDIPN